MNRLYASLLAIGCAAGTQAQVIFNMLAPQNLAGTYDITWTDQAGGWGTVDMLDPANSVEDTLVFVSDGTAADSLGCEDLVNAADVNGNIAVCYRGVCEFGMKGLKAQTAGARALIIINNQPGAPVAMGAGAEGVNDTIPIVMISDVDGSTLLAAIEAGVAYGFIGSINGLFTNDIGFFRSDVLIPQFGSYPPLLATNGTEYQFQMGIWVTNYGTADQTGVTATATITQDLNTVYTITSDPIDIVSGDSVFIDLGDFIQPSYAGNYSLDYTLQSTTGDEFDSNNAYSTTFSINEIFSYSTMDFGSGLPISNSHANGSAAGGSELCVHFRDPNASRVGVPGIYFSAVSTTAGTDIDGELFGIKVYHWTDEFGGYQEFIDLAQDPSLDIIQSNDFEMPAGYVEGSMVYAPLITPVILEDNLRYMFCIEIYSELFRVGYNSVLNYERNQTTYDQPITQVYDADAGTWFVGGFTGGGAATTGIQMVDANSIGLDENTGGTDALPYPNPAEEQLRIPMKGFDGNTTIRISDAAGKLIATHRVNASTGTAVIPTTGHARGLYSFEMISDKGTTRAFKVMLGR